MSSFNFSVKYVAMGVISFILFMIGLNSYTVVEDGEAKTAKMFGEISEEVYRAGFHIVNPLVDMTTFDIKENMFKLNDVTIPSQDKFKSTADVSVKWKVDPNKLPELQRSVGSQEQIQDKILVQPLLSILREAGRDVEKAQDLFKADVQDKVQTKVLQDLAESTRDYGITIQAVYIKDITLPDVIQKSIVTTKQLEEQENQEKARLKQQELIYARQTAEAEAKAKSAEQEKIATQLQADANAYSMQKEADATLYSKQKEAEGNIALAKSVTADLLKLKDLEVAKTNAENWKGGCTSNCTELSGDNKPVALYHLGK